MDTGEKEMWPTTRPQRRDDELLGVMADLQGFESDDRYFRDGALVGAGFVPDEDLRVHGCCKKEIDTSTFRFLYRREQR